MAAPSKVDVPRPSSSRMTSEFGVAFLRTCNGVKAHQQSQPPTHRHATANAIAGSIRTALAQ
jgi:hypothetical protein